MKKLLAAMFAAATVLSPGMGGVDNIDRVRHVGLDRSRRRTDDVSTKLIAMRFCYCGYKTE
jgi:hypothetical protein